MARVNGILGPLSGRVGNLVFYYSGGNSYVRSRPMKTTKAPSRAQTVQRARFALAMGFVAPLWRAVKDGFAVPRHNAPSVNQVMKQVLKEAVCGRYPKLHLDFPKVKVTKGPLEGLCCPVLGDLTGADGNILAGASSGGCSCLLLRWKWFPSRFNAAGNDLVKVVLYNENGKSFSLHEDAFRSDGKAVLSVPGSLRGDILHAYIFTESISGQRSCSQYLSVQL